MNNVQQLQELPLYLNALKLKIRKAMCGQLQSIIHAPIWIKLDIELLACMEIWMLLWLRLDSLRRKLLSLLYLQNVYFSFLPRSSLAQSTSILLCRGSLYAEKEHSQDLHNDSNSEQKRMPPSQSGTMKEIKVFITSSEVSQEHLFACPEEFSS